MIYSSYYEIYIIQDKKIDVVSKLWSHLFFRIAGGFIVGDRKNNPPSIRFAITRVINVTVRLGM
jgi:hypothetical protein